MKYNKVVEAKFIERPNRFVAYCDINGEIEKIHVKNTGRCKELLVPGCTVYLEETFWDMINKFQKQNNLSSRNDAIQVILSEWSILKQIDFNNIQVNVNIGDISQVIKQSENIIEDEKIEEDEDQKIIKESLFKMEEEMPD